MHGQGIKTFSNGDVFSGSWKEDKACGFGIKKFAGGDVHSGEYENDLRHGYGVRRKLTL